MSSRYFSFQEQTYVQSSDIFDEKTNTYELQEYMHEYIKSY